MRNKKEIIEINIDRLHSKINKINDAIICIQEELHEAAKAKYHLVENKDFELFGNQVIRLKLINETNFNLIKKINKIETSIKIIYKDIKEIINEND